MFPGLYVGFRLIQYPAAPCKGRITVTKEDLACLASGEFLNDVIIDFYLKSVCRRLFSRQCGLSHDSRFSQHVDLILAKFECDKSKRDF